MCKFEKKGACGDSPFRVLSLVGTNGLKQGLMLRSFKKHLDTPVLRKCVEHLLLQFKKTLIEHGGIHYLEDGDDLLPSGKTRISLALERIGFRQRERLAYQPMRGQRRE